MNTVIITLDVPVQPERMRNYPHEYFKIPYHEKMQGLKLGKMDDRHLSLLCKRFLISVVVSCLCCFLQVQKHATPEDAQECRTSECLQQRGKESVRHPGRALRKLQAIALGLP